VESRSTTPFLRDCLPSLLSWSDVRLSSTAEAALHLATDARSSLIAVTHQAAWLSA
jgi:hypothetical protein